MGVLIIFGIIFEIVAIVLLFIWRSQKEKLQNLRSANSTNIASLNKMVNDVAQEIGGGSLREYVKLRGIIECDEPIISELKEEPCVYYTMRVTREYEEEVTRKNDEGETIHETERRSETVAQNSRSIPFRLRDDSGEIIIDPQGANEIETVKVLEEFRPETHSGNSITFGNFSFAVSYGSGGTRTLGYRYTESILPIGRQALVIGMATDEDGQIKITKPSQPNQRFIISLKSEEEFARSTGNTIRGLFFGMLFCLSLGTVLLIAGIINR